MFENGTNYLSSEQTEEFGKVLIHSEDIFAKYDFYLIYLKGVKHHINTNDYPH